MLNWQHTLGYLSLSCANLATKFLATRYKRNATGIANGLFIFWYPVSVSPPPSCSVDAVSQIEVRSYSFTISSPCGLNSQYVCPSLVQLLLRKDKIFCAMSLTAVGENLLFSKLGISIVLYTSYF